ncbi:hypothetical protein GCM10009551_094740 [Nocardiopsis tropica]
MTEAVEMTQGRGAAAPEWLTDDVLDAPAIDEPTLDGAVTDVVGRDLVVVVDDHVQPGGVLAGAEKTVGTLAWSCWRRSTTRSTRWSWCRPRRSRCAMR